MGTGQARRRASGPDLGELGIGKSRIAETLRERLNNESHIRLRYFCSPHHQDNALCPSVAQLERAAGFRRDDADEQRLGKLEAVLARGTNDLSKAVPLLTELLSIPIGDRYPPLNLTPQKRKEKTLHAQLAQVEGLASQQSVPTVWEDLHWSDPTTRESLGTWLHVCDNGGQSPRRCGRALDCLTRCGTYRCGFLSVKDARLVQSCLCPLAVCRGPQVHLPAPIRIP
jgi:hypothetical protein